MNRKKHIAIVCLSCLYIGMTSSSCGETWDEFLNGESEETPSTKFTVVGTVVDAKTNEAITGANVRFYFNPDYYYDINSKSLIISKNTPQDGSFSFSKEYPDCRESLYIIVEASANGYAAFSEKVNIEQGKKTSLVVSLTPENAGKDDNTSEVSGAQVTITPNTISLGSNVTQAAMKLYNNTSENLQYTITDYPSFITVSPAASIVEANGVQTIIYGCDKSKVNSYTSRICRLNVGNNSYPITLNYFTDKIVDDTDVDQTTLIGTWYLDYFYADDEVGRYCDWGEYMVFRSDGTLTWNSRMYSTNTTYNYSRLGDIIICKCTYAYSPCWDASHFNMTLFIEKLDDKSLITYDTDEENLHRVFKKR